MGNIEKRGETSYRLSVSCGYDLKGKKIIKRKTIDLSDIASKKRDEEAQKQWLLFKHEVETGTFLDAEKISFEEFIIKWIDDYGEKQLAPKTIHRYKQILESRVIPALGHLKLNKIQPTHLLEFYNNLTEDGIRGDKKFVAVENFTQLLIQNNIAIDLLYKMSGVNEKVLDKVIRRKKINPSTAEKICKATNMKLKQLFYSVGQPGGLSDQTILHHHRVISAILHDAVEWQFILSNPADRVKPPKVTKKPVAFYDENQTKSLIKALENEPLKYQVMVLLDIFAGLRSLELMGLEWSDIDFDKNQININKASQYLKGKGIFTKSTKNASSNRVISLPKYIFDLLNEYKSVQDQERLKCGDLWKNSNRLFTTWDGKPLFPYSLSSWFPKFLKRHNLPKITPHGLRHTSATLLAAQGLEATAISKRLGHARTSTTMEIYAHALRSSDHHAANLLESALLKSIDNNNSDNIE